MWKAVVNVLRRNDRDHLSRLHDCIRAAGGGPHRLPPAREAVCRDPLEKCVSDSFEPFGLKLRPEMVDDRVRSGYVLA